MLSEFSSQEIFSLSANGWDLLITRQCLNAAKYYALSNQVFCLVSSQIWTQDQCDRICETEEQKNMMKSGYGFTCILGPNAVEIGNHLEHDEEGITYADIDLTQIIPGKFLIDTAGHYSTPGFLSLNFDRTVHTSVKKIGDTKPTVYSYEDIQEF